MSLSRKVGGSVLRAKCSKDHNQFVEGIFGLIEQQLVGGATLRDGLRIGFGWSMFTVRRSRNGYRLLEPDFDSDPSCELRENLDTSLSGYRRQQLLIAQLELDRWDPVPFHADVIAEHGAVAEKRFIAKRMVDPKGENGWFAFRIHKSKSAMARPDLKIDNVWDRFGTLPVWHTFHTRPALFDALALPVGYTVFIDGEKIESVLNDSGESWSI